MTARKDTSSGTKIPTPPEIHHGTTSEKSFAEKTQLKKDTKIKEPKVGHAGHRRTVDDAPVICHDTLPCTTCNVACSVTFVSKMMLDFDGDTRLVSHTRHTGYAAVCGCNKTIQLSFCGTAQDILWERGATPHPGIFYPPHTILRTILTA